MQTSGSAVGAAGQRWFLLGLILLFVGLSVDHSFKAVKHKTAALRWKLLLLDMLENSADISARYNYPNPPIMAVLLAPLAQLPDLALALVWFYVKVGLTLLVLMWVFRLVETPDQPFPLWAKGVAILLSLRPILSDLQHGNVNLFILFLVVAFLTLYRLGRDLSAGCALGLAIACKVTPALFVPYLVWKRAWRSLIGCGAGLLLFLWPGFVPAAVIGWQENQRQLRSWYLDMVQPFVIEGKVTSDHQNQSLPGLVARLLTHSPSFSDYDEQDQYRPLVYDNVLDLSAAQARWLIKGCLAGFALLVVWLCRTPTQPRQGWRLGAEFGVVLLGMLLFSERTWKHHCVTQIVPFAVLCYWLAVVAEAGWRRYLVVGILILATLLIAATSTAPFGYDFGKQAQVYGGFTLANVLLLAGLFVVLADGVCRPSASPLPSTGKEPRGPQ
jgi:hypothetical protein